MTKARIKDGLTLFSSLTISKAWNLAKLLAGYHLSRALKKPVQWGSPSAISFEPTTACNLGCPECPSGLKQFTRETGKADPEFFKTVLDQLSNHLLYLTFYFQGEPYINPGFLDMVKYASSKNIYTATSTNAHFLSDANAKRTVESGLHRLIISIDGVTQEVYENYRINGKVSKVIEGAKNIVRWKKKLKSSTPHVIFQFLVVRPNEHQAEDVQKLGEELGVDEVKFKTAQVYDYKNGNPLIPEQEQFSRYKQQNDGTWSIKNKLLNQCWKMWHSCVITWDGLVVPCCFDKDATHRLGDLKKETFEQAWKGGAYKNFRAAILQSRSEIDICKNCTEGTKVWA